MTRTYADERARELLVDKLFVDFYTSSAYDPAATRNADTVKAAIRFTLSTSQPDSDLVEKVESLCEGCPPADYPTDKTRCLPCPRRPTLPRTYADGIEDELWNAIKHGDDEHRAWLKGALQSFFAGLPVPAPRGGGTLSPSPSGIEDARETFETVRAWCDETFGPATPESIIKRAAEEWAEMEDAADQDSRTIEAVDVVIILCRMPGFVEAFQRKMAINRARKWRLTGNGTGYHIPDALCESASSKIGGDHG